MASDVFMYKDIADLFANSTFNGTLDEMRIT